MNRLLQYLLPEYYLLRETFRALPISGRGQRGAGREAVLSAEDPDEATEATFEIAAAQDASSSFCSSGVCSVEPEAVAAAEEEEDREGAKKERREVRRPVSDYDWLDDLTQKPRQRKINYTEADLERDLAEIIGLENVKNTIRDIYYTVRANQERQASGLETSAQLLHMMFYGNPGTGKTTVARLVGRMFREMGVLSRGHFVEVEASDLIAGYVGQTGPKTQAKIREALGGVLFIDEAYALVPEDDTRNSFGPEAIAVLIKAMEDHRDNLCVILAGYEDEMKRLFRVNPGLRSRVPFVLHFPDYTPPELLRIFVAEAAKRQYRIERDGGEYLLELFTTYQANMRELGNGRFARNVLERAILAQSRRLGALGRKPTPEELMLLTLEDLMAWERAGGGHA